MTPKLYIFNGSPPARTVLITAKAVGLNVEAHVFTTNQELKSPEFLKINPAHTVPVLNDKGKIICDSHAIAAYLVTKYAKNDLLYPKDAQLRAQVDQKLYFDAGVLYPTFKNAIAGFIRKEYKQIPKEKVATIDEVYGTLERFLDGNKWLAGRIPTLADISCATTTTALNHIHPIKPGVFPKVVDWLRRVRGLPYFFEDEKQFDHFKRFVQQISNWD
ncbi:glutathione S-transferase 1-like [Photinus pyralis]|uniref:Glutathione S-transferase n=1 Tax=Photinus pyralis TaxID=7054 RepID=A0A1Y1K7T6_PHOPY|nr:glutathione S-transferase 1-like [Photinus pyralis]